MYIPDFKNFEKKKEFGGASWAKFVQNVYQNLWINYFQIYLRYKFYTEVFLIGAQKLFTYLKVQSNKTRVLNEI